MHPTLLAIAMPGAFEMILIAGLGLLIFGRRLPEVGKGLARSIVEFKKGLREVTEEMDTPSSPARPTAISPTATPSTPQSTTPAP
jgi:sec-independent protein translocase protein TatA